MPYLFVGAGQAGSAIVDEVFSHSNMDRIASPIVFNSTVRDLQSLSNIGPGRWFGISEGDGLVPGTVTGFEQKVTGGFGRDPKVADEVMTDLVHQDRLIESLRAFFNVSESDPPPEIPYTFIFVGLGGGTGCGISAHVAEGLRELTEDRTQIIAVGILPNTEGPVKDGSDDTEATPSRQAWNTRFGLDALEDTADGIILVDNQRLSYHIAAEGKFSEFNEYVASAFVDFVSGPEQINPGDFEDIDVPTVDLRDLVTSISFGMGDSSKTPGYAALGRSVTMTKSLTGYLLPFVGKRSIDSTALTELADSKVSVSNLDSSEAEKAIGLVRAPPKRIRNSDSGIETSVFRRHLEAKCNEVNVGLTLTDRNLASFSMLLTYRRSEIDRIAEIEQLADEYEQQRPEIQ